MEYFLSKDYIYLLIGVAIILLSLLFRKALGNHSVNLKIDPIGFNLIADRLTLFFLLGFTIIGFGVFFKFKGYETRLSDFEKKLLKSEIFEAQLNAYREYEFDLELVFDPPLEKSPKEYTYEVVNIKDGQVKETPVTPRFGRATGVRVHLEHINPGAKIRITASRKSDNEQQEYEEIWISEEIEIPNSKIRLKKEK
jgi:hypothetical protein